MWGGENGFNVVCVAGMALNFSKFNQECNAIQIRTLNETNLDLFGKVEPYPT